MAVDKYRFFLLFKNNDEQSNYSYFMTFLDEEVP